MGYNNRELIAGSQGAGVTFLAIGKDGTMGDLKVTGYGDEGYADNGITAVKLDTFGRNSGSTMFWCDYEEDGTTWYGWYDGDWEQDLNAIPLASGEGVWFKSPSADYKIVSSGQVNSEVIPVTLIAGSQLCPNATPVTLKMNKARIFLVTATKGMPTTELRLSSLIHLVAIADPRCSGATMRKMVRPGMAGMTATGNLNWEKQLRSLLVRPCG